MPDLKSELNKVLTTWTKDDPTSKVEPTPPPAPTPAPTQPPRNGRYFTPTNNVTRETFNYVRDNPGVTRAKAVADLKAKGYLDGSVHSLLGQMVKQGLITEAGTDRRMMCVASEYTPLKSSRLVYRKPQPSKEDIKPKRKYVRKAKPEAAEGPTLEEKKAAIRATLPPAPAPEGLISSGWSADTIMEHLSIKQARALYEELKKVFGN